MNEPMTRIDRLVAAALFGVALMLRVPFRSTMPYHWDCAEFALAIQHYDLRVGQPHAPGYFLYVALGRAVNVLVCDPHASLVWISVVAGAALPVLGFLLGTALYGRASGVATGAILATSPLCWFHSEVALTTIVDAALVTATMLAGWHAMQRRGRWRDVVTLAVLLAWVAGNRPQSAVGLFPAWVFLFMKFERHDAKLAVGTALFALFCLLWLWPLVAMSGGWREFFRLLAWKLDFDSSKTLFGGGIFSSLAIILRSCWAGLLAAGVVVVVGWRWRAAGSGRLLAWWILPMIAFGLLTYTTMPGYVLGYFPALAIAAGRVCRRWFLIVPVALVNTVAFLGYVPIGLPLTAQEIRTHDRQLASACALIRRRYWPEEVLLCHRQEFFLWGLRHFQYHLPQYRNCLLGRDVSLPAERAGQYRVCHGAQTEFLDDWHQAVNGRRLLLVVPPGDAVELFADRVEVAHAVPVGTGLFELTLDGRDAAGKHRAP